MIMANDRHLLLLESRDKYTGTGFYKQITEKLHTKILRIFLAVVCLVSCMATPMRHRPISCPLKVVKGHVLAFAQ